MIPKWQRFSVQSCAKYLGIHMGPLAHLAHWMESGAKWSSRSRMIGSHSASASLAALTYNLKAVTVLSYEGQFLPVPQNLFHAERVAIHRILKAPMNTFDSGTLFNMHLIGGPRFTSLK
eukprot:11002319-Karenia_brevis.AAC.1